MAKRARRRRRARTGSGKARSAAGAVEATPESDPRWLWACALVLVLAVAAVYAEVAGHEFVMLDDAAYFLRNPNLDGRFGLDDLTGAFARPYFANWIPVTSLSIALDNHLYGADPTGVLVTNVVLHAAASVLLLLALARLSGRLAPSAFVAGVFALHPLHVESVAWAAQRKDVLMAVGWCGTMLAYAHWRERPGAARRAAWIGAAAFAMLAKPVAVTLPFALLLLDFWPLRRFGERLSELPRRSAALRAAVVEKWPLFALAALASAATLHAQTAEGADQSVRLALGYRLLNAARAYADYVVDGFWPSGLAAHYPYRADALFDAPVFAAAAAGIALTAAALWLAGRRPWLLVGWLWFLGTLVPMIGLVHVGTQARADRYTYIPLIGLALAVAWTAVELADARPALRRALAGAGLAALVALAVLAQRQVGTWRDSEALFLHAIEVTRDNDFAHTALGAHYRESHATSLAERHLVAALRIRPDSGDARSDLGMLRIDQGRLEDARRELERALDAGAPPAKVHTALGIAAERSGDTAGAIGRYRLALAADPGRLEAANNLAWQLATASDPALRAPREAIAIAERIAAWNGHDAAVIDTLAAAYAAAGRWPDAVATQQRALAALGSRDGSLRRDLEARLRAYRAKLD